MLLIYAGHVARMRKMNSVDFTEILKVEGV
jgi:hypothetical protein